MKKFFRNFPGGLIFAISRDLPLEGQMVLFPRNLAQCENHYEIGETHGIQGFTKRAENQHHWYRCR